MTLLELRTALWEELGELPNCDPADAAGLARLNGWINRGYKKILFWKFGDGTQLRLPATEGEMDFQFQTVTGMIASSTTTTVVLDASAGAEDDQYNGWLMESDQENVLIVDYGGTTKTATLSKTLGTAPSGTYTLYKNFMRFCKATDVGALENIVLSPVSSIKSVQKLILLEDQTEIVPAQRTETFAGGFLSPGRPTSYLRRGTRLVFDRPVDEEYWCRLEYVRIPPDIASDDEEPEMPETFHEAVLLWALWRGYRWSQETDMSYATKRDLIDFMVTTRNPEEMANDREDARMELENFF